MASSSTEPNPVGYLQAAYEQTLQATSAPNEWRGTTTACGALLHHTEGQATPEPVLYVTNLGDSQVMVLRSDTQEMVYKTTEQWHWFDCPRQLGTNSPDTPIANAVMDKLGIKEGDVVLAMSDGVVDNLWEHEILKSVHDSMKSWVSGGVDGARASDTEDAGGRMLYVARELVKAARNIAEDPYAESPFMERAVEEGLAMEGGKLDDISVTDLKPAVNKLGDCSMVVGASPKKPMLPRMPTTQDRENQALNVSAIKIRASPLHSLVRGNAGKASTGICTSLPEPSVDVSVDYVNRHWSKNVLENVIGTVPSR
ncbi:MAG: hypothetical protein Q9197_003360 [Variospora fuerteventurae]